MGRTRTALTRTAPEQPRAAALRTALYRHAFNPAADAATARVLDWVQQASLPVARLADPVVLRQALDALTLRMDGRRAAANTVIRKRAVFHGALGTRSRPGCWNPTRPTGSAGGFPAPARQPIPRSWPAPPRPRRC